MARAQHEDMAHAFIRSYIEIHNSDFHAKERMAEVAAALYLGAAAVLLFRQPFWRDYTAITFLLFCVWIGASSFLLGYFVWWQMAMRDHANRMSAACGNLAVRWLTEPPLEADLQPSPSGVSRRWRAVDVEWPTALTHEYNRLALQKDRGIAKFRNPIFIALVLWGMAVFGRVVLSWVCALTSLSGLCSLLGL